MVNIFETRTLMLQQDMLHYIKHENVDFHDDICRIGRDSISTISMYQLLIYFILPFSNLAMENLNLLKLSVSHSNTRLMPFDRVASMTIIGFRTSNCDYDPTYTILLTFLS